MEMTCGDGHGMDGDGVDGDGVDGDGDGLGGDGMGWDGDIMYPDPHPISSHPP